MSVKNVKITVLIEDSKNSAKPQLRNKHGVSFFVRAKIGDDNVTALMDVGPSGEALLHNVDVMGVNLEDVDGVALSHGPFQRNVAMRSTR